MHYTYLTHGICPKSISFDIDENEVVTNVHFEGGCPGNTQGISILVEGMKTSEIIKKLKGVECGIRGTSCPDQLANALTEAREKMHQNQS